MADKNEIETLKSKIADLLFKLNNDSQQGDNHLPEDRRQRRLQKLEKHLSRLIELKYGRFGH